jgi:hypothetical protein
MCRRECPDTRPVLHVTLKDPHSVPVAVLTNADTSADIASPMTASLKRAGEQVAECTVSL